MASVVKRTRQDGSPSYFVKYRDGGGRIRWEQFGKAKAAQARKAEVEVELSRSGGTWQAPTRQTFRTVAEAWMTLNERTLTPHTVRNYRTSLRKHLLPTFGDQLVTAIRRSEVEAFAASLARGGMAAGSITQVVGLLSRILAALVQDGQLERNVAARIGRHGRRSKKAAPPTHKQVDRVLAAASVEGRPVIELATGSGLRRGEIFRLTWADVDLEANEFTVRESKTEAGERVVPMFGSVRRVLLEQKARSRFKRPHDLVFPTVVGTPESPPAWALREWYPAMERAKLVGAFRFHDLRHYAVSRLIEQGANILLVSRVAGHARPSVTLDVYAHLFKEGLAEAAVRFDPLRRAVDVR